MYKVRLYSSLSLLFAIRIKLALVIKKTVSSISLVPPLFVTLHRSEKNRCLRYHQHDAPRERTRVFAAGDLDPDALRCCVSREHKVARILLGGEDGNFLETIVRRTKDF